VRLTGPVLAFCVASAAAAGAADEAPKVAGTEVPVPKRIKFVAPDYPPEAQAKGMRGIVILDLTIDIKGKVQAVEVTRSVPPFDEAAIAAVKQWEYEPTKVGSKPVSVRLTVPITFALKLPEMKREAGIPELRQGAAPGMPASDATGTHTVAGEIVIAADGQIAEGGVTAGESPWADALLLAVRTWRFAPTTDGAPLRFKLKADFVSAEGNDKPAKVVLELSDPQHLQSMEAAAPAATPGPPQPEPGATSPQPVASPASVAMPSATPEAAAAPPQAVVPPLPAPSPAAAKAEPRPTPSGPVPKATPRAPEIEVISPAPPPPPPPGPEGLGVSVVRDVRIEAGLPDLVKGRRPLVPPLARMNEVEGTVEAHFAVDASGGTSNVEAMGPDLLRVATIQTIQSWGFRRTKADRLYLIASFTYAGDQASSVVKPAPEETTPPKP
jgi:TonB family protein